MLFLLAGSLLLTALIVHKTYTAEAGMRESAKELERNLHKKESYIYSLIQDKAALNQFKSIGGKEKGGLRLINEVTATNGINFIIAKNNTVTFWSGIEVIPHNINNLKEGVSFIHGQNGYYEAIKKSEGTFALVFFIPIKNTYVFENPYLQNTFNSELTQDNNITIADFTDNKDIYEVHDVNNHYLFSVKAVSGKINSRFYYTELTLWFLAFMVAGIFVQNSCNYIARKGLPFLSLTILATFIIGIRSINLIYHWPDITSNLKLFDIKLFTDGIIVPSLGDLCINILALCWFVIFLYHIRQKLLQFIPGAFSSYAIFVSCFAVLVIISTVLYNLFADLVIQSNISFDVSNVLNLSVYSGYGLLMLCFSFLTFCLLVEVLLVVCVQLPIPTKQQLILFIAGIALCTLGWYIEYRQVSVFYVLWAAIVIVRGYAYFCEHGVLSYRSLAALVFICSFISAISLTSFQKVKERATRQLLIKNLRTPDDAIADSYFKKIENKIITDRIITDYFTTDKPGDEHIKNYLQKRYFDGYLSKFDLKIHTFDHLDKPLSGNENYSFNIFALMVEYGSFKVSDFFYRQTTFGLLSYFAILPVKKDGETVGKIVVELGSNTLHNTDYFPALLADGPITTENNFKDYSYAFYSDNKLTSQAGNYVYNLINDPTSEAGFNGITGDAIFKQSNVFNNIWYDPVESYSHLIFKPNDRSLIVASKIERPIFNIITSLTFFFIILLVFGALVMAFVWAWTRIKILTITNNRIKWGVRLNFDKVLYKTRIQVSMVSAVVVTLILVGAVTYASISTQYQSQQEKTIRDKIVRIANTIENARGEYISDNNETAQIALDELAESYAADLTIFDAKGNVKVTTQPRIYEAGLVAGKMDARSFIHLSKLQRSEYINEERIGELRYKAVYASIRNTNKNETIAYLQLPYFSNEADYRERIGTLLNVMINIYALIFIAIGLFAVIIARQITYPLNFIQQSLSKTIYGQKIEPIQWHRDDEIGALITEYNKMIAALEQSALKLAQSERESAWREMAKQVAHEIKNPLTPLKLGLQLLEKSWREKDPRFDQKFERFSKSFVEQIESLSSIASEFSAFAKMPDTRLDKFNVFDVINQAVIIFKQMDNFTIKYNASERPFIINADRDQLLRCFNNLLKNAIEATPPERAGVIDISYETSEKNILFTIKDNGNGIPENMREKIFEPNFTTKSSGTGLGLAFVKNSIENAGGKVWFETKTGEGTSFYLNFPKAG
ncbi:HAMP domain-containing protein [Mucilaginibacter auburnensis]|uniref:histidine kinase n=2 Tax=Mucilaginibacter auburnensis TaxID=1457233 RepID=A0A2H9VPM7_9SPHI|nr:HAMP domain-containing protein [Mucilaginibacter auburnensis]